MRNLRKILAVCLAALAAVSVACGSEGDDDASALATSTPSTGCTITAQAPPYLDRGDSVLVPVSGRCEHMTGGTGEFAIKVDGTDHGEVNTPPTFDGNGKFSATPFVTQDGAVCGRPVTITISGTYDAANQLRDTGSTTFNLECTTTAASPAPKTAAPQAAARTAAPPAAASTPAPTPTPYQTQTSNGCTISVAAPPYKVANDFINVDVSGSCQHMRAPDTGEFKVFVDGADHGEVNDVPKFDAAGKFSARPFIKNTGNVCGHQVRIQISGKYDFNNNLSDTGSTTFTLVCA